MYQPPCDIDEITSTLPLLTLTSKASLLEATLNQENRKEGNSSSGILMKSQQMKK